MPSTLELASMPYKASQKISEEQFLRHLGVVYSKNSLAVNNLYVWLQCVIDQMPDIPTPMYNVIKTEQDSPLFEDKVRFVAALTIQPVTQD
jgi:hypothetical protein